MLTHLQPVRMWAKNRHTAVHLAVAAVCVGFALLTRDIIVEWPDIVGGSTLRVPLAALSPLPVTIAQTVVMYRIDPVAETRGLRPIWILDLATTVLTMIGFLIVAACYPTAEGAGVAARNALLLTGTALIGTTLTWRPIAAVIPTLWFLASTVAGQSGGGLHAWALPAWPADPWTWNSATAVLAVGLAITAIRRRPINRLTDH